MTETDESPDLVERPRSATVIAWVWIIFAAGSIVSGIKDFLNARKLAAALPAAGADANVDAVVDRFSGLVGGTPLELTFSVIFGIVVITGAVGLLKLRPWGRIVLIAVTWTALIGMLIGQPLLLLEVTDLATLGTDEFSFFEILIWTIGIAQLVFALVIFGLMLRALHGERIRAAIQLASRGG